MLLVYVISDLDYVSHALKEDGLRWSNQIERRQGRNMLRRTVSNGGQLLSIEEPIKKKMKNKHSHIKLVLGIHVRNYVAVNRVNQ